MCNGNSGRTSEGGTVATMKSIHDPKRPEPSRELSFRLTDNATTRTTTVALDGWTCEDAESQIVIHVDGDLRSESMSVLHRIYVPRLSEAGTSFNLNSRLDLGVGGMGVIGRRVSLVRNHVVLSQGVIGWN